jgi:Tfp pilus assembly protein PilX
MKPRNSQQGDIAIYVALIMVTVLLSGAFVFSSVLSRQARYATNVVQNERAFYSADSGIEATLYELKAKLDLNDVSVSEVKGDIEYKENKARFVGQGNLSLTTDQLTTQACVSSTGTFDRESRQLVTGPASCEGE